MNTNVPLKRLENGKAMNDYGVVPADLIALVSGVNLASVNKVLLALNVISDVLDTHVEALIDPTALPADRAGQQRYEATDRIAQSLLNQPETLLAEPYLHFIDRMSRH